MVRDGPHHEVRHVVHRADLPHGGALHFHTVPFKLLAELVTVGFVLNEPIPRQHAPRGNPVIGQVNRQCTATQCSIRLKEAKVGERDLSARQPEELDHHVVLHTVGRHDDVTDIERRIHRPGRAGTDHGLGVERIDQNLCAEGGIHLPNARPDEDKIVPVPRRLMKGKSRPLRRAQDLAAVEIQLHFDVHRRHDGQRHTDAHLNYYFKYRLTGRR
jgi:hypothetical protein